MAKFTIRGLGEGVFTILRRGSQELLVQIATMFWDGFIR